MAMYDVRTSLIAMFTYIIHAEDFNPMSPVILYRSMQSYPRNTPFGMRIVVNIKDKKTFGINVFKIWKSKILMTFQVVCMYSGP